MSWLTPTLYERELFENLRSSLSPDILSLAKYCVLTPRIEPLLLRNMRMELMPASEPELEHQLWYSALISARSTRNIVLHQGVARLLADELRVTADEPSEEFAKVWKLTQSNTSHWPPLDKLEQQLRYDALLSDQAAIDMGLQEILRAINRSTEKDTRLNLARWAKKTLPAIAGETTASEETAWLAQYAATTLGATANWTKLSANQPLPDWLQTTPVTSSAKIGLQLRYDSEHGYQVLECLPAEESSITLPLPTPLPATIYIQCENQTKGVWEIINPGIRIKIAQPSRRIFLSTIDGKRYELNLEIELPTENQDRETINTIYLTYLKEDEELARHIATQLAEQDILVTLLTESSTDFNRLKSWQNDGGGSKFLRLWTPVAQRQWQSEDWEDHALADNSLLLRWQQAELPSGAAGAGVVDWDERLPDINPIKQWLSGQPITTDTRWLQQALNDLGASPRLIVDNIDGPTTRQAVKNFQTKANLFADGVAGPQTITAIERQLVLNKLLRELEDPQTKPKRRLAIGDQLTELGDPRKGVGVVDYQVLEYAPEVQQLLDELSDINTQPPRRLEIGNLLAEMGDPRFGVGLDEHGLPEIDWVEIPAGPFIYGEGESQQTLDLPHYKISRYPVTNSQFQAFLDDGGYQDERWWQGFKKPESKQPRFDQANRPRESVDWFEALAFTRWLSARLGVNVSLPTEQQWEKAARGTDGRMYPWGNEFRSGFANCNEIVDNQGPYYLKQTSAVGIYPQGESPYKIADMAGNVWEWCLNAYDHPEHIDSNPIPLKDRNSKVLKDSEGSKLQSDERRVLRGGSWYSLLDNLRSATRSRNYPDARSSDVGFRLAQD